MKKTAFTTLFLLLITGILVFAQVPQKISYQAVIRDANGDLVVSDEAGIQISIFQGSATGTAVYTETHQATTNVNGLATVEIGGGTVVSGDFPSIDWSDGPYFLKTGIDPAGGTSYTITGTSQMLSVPYALQAGTIDNYDELLSKIEELQFRTSVKILDVDSNIYHTIVIGTQTWMDENLKTATYNDGTPIDKVPDSAQWVNLSTGAYCWANNDSVSYENVYGKFYNWYAVNTGNLCPAGWHVPTRDEWIILRDYLGGSLAAPGKLKEAGTAHWSVNPNGTNESGFTALPGGNRSGESIFGSPGSHGYWWSASELSADNAYLVIIYSNDIAMSTGTNYSKKSGYSVRCLKD